MVHGEMQWTTRDDAEEEEEEDDDMTKQPEMLTECRVGVSVGSVCRTYNRPSSVKLSDETLSPLTYSLELNVAGISSLEMRDDDPSMLDIERSSTVLWSL